MSGTRSLNTEAYWRASLRVLLALLLVSPFLIWLIYISEWEFPPVKEWLPLVFVSGEQALVSSLLSLFFGWLMFLGAESWIERRQKQMCEVVLLLPNLTPPLFLILSLLAWVTPWAAFPYGLNAVIFAHVLMNSGLVAIALDRLVQSKLGGMTEAAWTLGASRYQFWTRVAWPFLKFDLACLFLFVFSICFTSFSIPFMLGGETWATLEVAIFDTIRADGRWDKAVILAAGQSLFLLALAVALPRQFWPPRPQRRPLPFLGVPQLRQLVFLPALILVGGWLLGLPNSFKAHLEPGVADAVMASLALGLSVGLLHLVFFLVTAYASPHLGLQRFLNGYLSPSSAITGFAMLLLPGSGETIDFVKLVLALTLISFPLLYRWIVHAALDGLQNQILVARTLGARWSTVLFEIVWPQAAPQILRASGLAAFWGAADFAITAVVAGDFNTLPLMMTNLMGNYSLPSAELLMIPLFMVSLGLYGLFTGAARYVSR